MNRPVLAALCGIFLVMAAFGQSPSGPASPRIVILDIQETDSSLEATLYADETLLIRVAGNPTTGYSWEITGITDPTILVPQGDIEYEPANPGLLGSPGTFLIRVSGVREGQATLELTYRRPWEKNKPALRTVSIDIHVLKSAE